MWVGRHPDAPWVAPDLAWSRLDGSGKSGKGSGSVSVHPPLAPPPYAPPRVAILGVGRLLAMGCSTRVSGCADPLPPPPVAPPPPLPRPTLVTSHVLLVVVMYSRRWWWRCPSPIPVPRERGEGVARTQSLVGVGTLPPCPPGGVGGGVVWVGEVGFWFWPHRRHFYPGHRRGRGRVAARPPRRLVRRRGTLARSDTLLQTSMVHANVAVLK